MKWKQNYDSKFAVIRVNLNLTQIPEEKKNFKFN